MENRSKRNGVDHLKFFNFALCIYDNLPHEHKATHVVLINEKRQAAKKSMKALREDIHKAATSSDEPSRLGIGK